MPDRVWYYSTGGGQQQGPIKTAQLKQLALEGELRPGDLVWSDGMANWTPASTVKGLFPSEPTGGAAATEEATTPATAANSGAALQAQAAPYSQQLSAATELAGTASRQALAAFKSLLADPVGGMGGAFRQLSSPAALQVGIAFLVVFLLLVLGSTLIAALPIIGMVSGSGARAIFQQLTAMLAMMVAMIGVVAVFRSVSKSAAGYQADLFIVGASLLPLGFAMLLASVLNLNSRVVMAIVAAVLVFAMTYLVLMLYSGLAQIVRLTDRLASLAVATILVAAGAAVGLVSWIFSLV